MELLINKADSDCELSTCRRLWATLVSADYLLKSSTSVRLFE
jgi:hypothetical protein